MNNYISMSSEMLAAKRQDDPNTIYRLLEKGEDPNAEDEDRSPLLGWAAWRGYTEIVRLLIDKGVNINTRGSDYETPLHHASMKGHIDIVRLLIEHQADVNLADRGGSTALMRAQAKGYEEIVEALFAAGALEDVSETPEQKQREREKIERYALDLELARREFLSRAEDTGTAVIWAGAWADPVGPGSSTFVFHADGTVVSCNGNKTREVAHLDDPGDGTMFYKMQNGKTTEIKKWTVSEDGKRLSLDYGGFVATFKRL